jgi:hypothetical protein
MPVQVAVDQAAQASPTGNLARKVRAVYEGAHDVVQAAAALRLYTAERARFAPEARLELGCSADAVTVKEHKEMIGRYKMRFLATAIVPHGENTMTDDQVGFQ